MLVPPVPDRVPRFGNRFTRWLGRRMLGVLGWRVEGEIPNREQLVICGAPHTSNWDFVIAMAVNLALGVKFSYLMKREAFFWPFAGLFMRLGGIPLNRSDPDATVAQVTQWFHEHEKVWLAITPEGTRSGVEKWKTGYLRIAHEVGVPVWLVSWHYPKKTLYMGDLWPTSGHHAEDAATMKAHVDANFSGIS